MSSHNTNHGTWVLPLAQQVHVGRYLCPRLVPWCWLRTFSERAVHGLQATIGSGLSRSRGTPQPTCYTVCIDLLRGDLLWHVLSLGIVAIDEEAAAPFRAGQSRESTS